MTNVLGAAIVEISGDYEELEKDVATAKTKVTSAFKQMEKSAGKISGGTTKLFKGAFSAIAKAAKVAFLGIAAGVGAVGLGLGKLVADALPLEGVRNAFDGLTESFEGGSEAMLGAMQEGSLGMVNQMDLMKSYNSANQLVGEDFANRLPEAFQYLSKVSAATGEDMGFMIDSMVKGVGRLSPMILDNLGIQVDMVQASEDWAEANDRTVESMTKGEQQAALMDQVLGKLAENTAAMPEVAGTATQMWESMKTQFKDTGLEIGEGLIPVFMTLMETIQPMIDQYLPILLDWLGQLPEKLTPIITAFGDFIAMIMEGTSPLDALTILIARIAPPEFLATFLTIKDTLLNFFDIIRTFMDEHGQLTIQIIAAIVAGLAAFSIIMTVISWVTGMISAVAALGSAISAAGGIITFIIGVLGGPLTIAIGLIIALVAFLALAWNNNWFGIRDTLTKLWEGKIKPLFEELQKWLKVVIPQAIEILKSFWENTLKPALERFGAFLTGTVFPFLGEVARILIEVVGAAAEGLAVIWETILLPAITAIWAFIQDPLMPLLSAISELISAVLGVAVTALAGIWQNVLLPALQDVWKWVESVLFPIFEELNDWVSGTLTEAMDDLQGAISPLAVAFAGIKSAIAGVITKIGALVAKIKNVSLPSWMVPGSPTPWEIGLRGVADAMNSLSYSALPSLSAELKATPNAITRNTNFNLNASYANYQTEESLGETVSFLNRLYG